MKADAAARTDTRERLLEAAEALMRRGGYHGFSTRDVAAAVGIKAASAHYHFPTKTALGEAVIERYQSRFFEALGDPKKFGGDRAAALDAYVEAFRRSLREDGQLCLCGVLGAESAGLPAPLAEGAARFFARNLLWLTTAFTAAAEDAEASRDPAPHALAAQTLATLEGGMLVAAALDDEALLDRAAGALAAAL